MADVEFYHALNRRVDKKILFLDDQDRQRFILGLDLFNDEASVDNLHRMVNGTYVRPTRSNRRPLVRIHAWCLMGNHYHLLLSETQSGGMKRFLMKLNVGYAKYFNERYKRSGTLFQGRTKKVRIATDAHFLHILNYIHLNPLDFMRGSETWRERTIQNPAQALAYLKSYTWSSYLDYCGEINLPHILYDKVFKKVFPNYSKTLRDYLATSDIADIQSLTLE